MSNEKDVTWTELESVAKNRLKVLMEEGPAQIQYETCVFVLTRELEYLKGSEGSGEKSSSMWAEE